MAEKRTLIFLISAIGTLGVALVLGYYFLLPREAQPSEVAAVEPEVVKIQIQPEEGEGSAVSAPSTEQVTSPLEVSPSAGLLTPTPTSPPLPVPSGPSAATGAQDRPQERSEQPEWVAERRTEPARRPSSPAAVPVSRRTETSRREVYWVQVGSFQSQTQAETLSSRLGSRGLHGTITTFRNDDVTLYRVRLGPFTHRAEAEAFLNRLKAAGGFEGAFVVRSG